jgi:serine/threonine-protein kinase
MPDTEAARCLAGRYRLDRPLGRGGMGEVWAASDLRLGRRVAVKVLRADLARLDEPRRRFETEARSAAQLVHPNVAAIFDIGGDDGTPFIVMELLSSRTLRDDMQEGPMRPADVRVVGRQVLSALSAAHDAGIVHRDVKPANVLRGGPEQWKLADFGIAKSIEAATDLTSTGLVAGTPAYLAPERLDGQPATPASDLYSVGVMLYEAVSGCRPFAADNPLATVHAIRTVSPPPLDQVRPGLDPDLLEVIERAMQRNPRRRFRDAEAMRAALTGRSGRVRVSVDPDTEPGGARTDPGGRTATSVLPRPPARTRRRRLGIPVAVAAVAAVVVAVALAASLGSGPSSPPTTTPPTTTAAPVTPTPPLPGPLAVAVSRLDRQLRP